MTIENQAPAQKPARSKHWLLAKSRQWHAWGGLTAGLFLLLMGTSGIVLNYKIPVFEALGLETGPRQTSPENRKKSKSSDAVFTTTTGLAAASISVDHVLELARQEWGDAALERIELKDERGELIYKVKRRAGAELWVNAVTGAHFVKEQPGRPARGSVGGTIAPRFDWGKFLLDLHTGKIGGEVGKAIVSTVALVLLFLVASGIYLWAKPLFIRRQNARSRTAAAASAAPRPIPASPRPPARELIEA
ncbi:MAG: PepSY domain-containing protein [Verrucomicrobia bacterium]|nr:PepSY domain-containing protein [Verrucomicrobiota bacterium]